MASAIEWRFEMSTVTLQGPVVVLPEKDYEQLLARLTRLERLVAEWSENREDIRMMREAEVEYRTGDSTGFTDLLAEMRAERE